MVDLCTKEIQLGLERANTRVLVDDNLFKPLELELLGVVGCAIRRQVALENWVLRHGSVVLELVVAQGIQLGLERANTRVLGGRNLRMLVLQSVARAAVQLHIDLELLVPALMDVVGATVKRQVALENRQFVVMCLVLLGQLVLVGQLVLLGQPVLLAERLLCLVRPRLAICCALLGLDICCALLGLRIDLGVTYAAHAGVRKAVFEVRMVIYYN